jgi:hypothetical protein
MFEMLNRVPNQVEWQELRTGETFGLESLSGDAAPIDCRAVTVSSHYPAYASRTHDSEAAVLGLVLTAPAGATIGFFPQLAQLLRNCRPLCPTRLSVARRYLLER